MRNDYWFADDGRVLQVEDMTNEHLVNAKAWIEKRLKNHEYRTEHVCQATTGRCIDCEDECELALSWESWVKRFTEELQRRRQETRLAG